MQLGRTRKSRSSTQTILAVVLGLSMVGVFSLFGGVGNGVSTANAAPSDQVVCGTVTQSANALALDLGIGLCVQTASVLVAGSTVSFTLAGDVSPTVVTLTAANLITVQALLAIPTTILNSVTIHCPGGITITVNNPVIVGNLLVGGTIVSIGGISGGVTVTGGTLNTSLGGVRSIIGATVGPLTLAGDGLVTVVDADIVNGSIFSGLIVNAAGVTIGSINAGVITLFVGCNTTTTNTVTSTVTATVTITVTNTVTLPASTTTVTLPASTTTVTAPASTVTLPASTTTVTAPGETHTVTLPASTTTVTASGVTHTVTVTQTHTVTSTVTAPGTTVTVTNTVTAPGSTSTVTVPGPTVTSTTTVIGGTTQTIVISGSNFVCTQVGTNASTLICYITNNGVVSGSTSSIVVAAHASEGAHAFHRLGANRSF